MLGSDWLVDAMNWVYIWGHWPVIVVVLVWLFVAHPAGYRAHPQRDAASPAASGS